MNTRRMTLMVGLLGIAMLSIEAKDNAASIRVGATLPTFSLKDLDGSVVSLPAVSKNGPLVLVVLRGWPGYQCPFCTRQFGDFLTHADNFTKANTTVVFIYPGPVAGLTEHAKEFKAARPMPSCFRFLVDPDMEWLKAHDLRWDAPNETSYPSTFVIDRLGQVRFSMTSKTHGGRASATQVLDVLNQLK